MNVYLDICCLKRPFDDQSQERIRLETEALAGILAAAATGRLALMHSPAHDLENALNPESERMSSVRALLENIECQPPSARRSRLELPN